MDMNNLKDLSDQWRALAAKAKGMEEISYAELLDIFRNTHKAFSALQANALIPRQAFQVIMLMDEFTYYAMIMDENYLGEIFPGLCQLNYAVKKEFFNGDYQSEFFIGSEPSVTKQYALDIESISHEDFIHFLKDELEVEFTEIKL